MKPTLTVLAFVLSLLVTMFSMMPTASAQDTKANATPQLYDPTKPAAATPGTAAVPLASILPALPTAEALKADSSKSFIWEVKSKTNISYLFGTIHVGKRTFYPLSSAVESALKRSQRLVVEADISNNEGMGDIDAIISYKSPDSLDQHIPLALFERLKVQLTRLNIPLDAVKPMKPFLVAGFLAVSEFAKLGYDMNFGVDGYLITKAKEDRKAILELESQAGQLKMLNEMPPRLQEAFLENAIGSLEAGIGPNQVTGMVNAWQSGDVTLMQDVAKNYSKNMRMTEQLDAVLLYSRHDLMIKKIETYLEGSESHFVAVGSLHLVGPRGLVEMLKARGYQVKQL